MIIEGNLLTHVKSICFDTSVSNTDHKTSYLSKEWRKIYCIEAVVFTALRTASGSDLIFSCLKDSKKQWKELNLSSNHEFENYPEKKKEQNINIASSKLKEQHRDDYRELLL